MVARDHPTFLSDSAPTALGYYIAVLLRWLAKDFPVATYPALQRVLRYLETRPATLKCAVAEALGPTPFTQPN
jgi:glutathione S-transferase